MEWWLIAVEASLAASVVAALDRMFRWRATKEIMPVGKFDDIVIRYESESGFFGWQKRNHEIRGNCTVWHYVPCGSRCSTEVEAWAAGIWRAWKWESEK